MTKDEAKNLAYKRLVDEYEEFIEEVKKNDVETILTMTREIELKRKIIRVFALSNYSRQKYELVLNTANMLDELYMGWLQSTEKSVKTFVERALKYWLEKEQLLIEGRDYP